MRRLGGWGGVLAGRSMASRYDGSEVSSLEAPDIASSRRAPPFAAEYLNTVLEDGDQQGLMIALRYMAKESQECRLRPNRRS
jgi:hypothetical protein